MNTDFFIVSCFATANIPFIYTALARSIPFSGASPDNPIFYRQLHMESYRGVKFNYQRRNSSFLYNERLNELNRWAVLFGQLGLAPVHSKGAYGNLSYRTGPESFMISKAGMIVEETLQPANYSHVIDYNQEENIFLYDGEAVPSSESILHRIMYTSFASITAILHGHFPLFEIHNEALELPITRTFEPYGSQELARSAIEIIDPERNFFLLRNHGFVAFGGNITQCGKTTLSWLQRLLTILQKQAH